MPGLRNVGATAPYFHDGSVATLAHAIRVMAKVQLNRALDDSSVRTIEAFLRSLTGALPSTFRSAPPAAASDSTADSMHIKKAG